MKKLAKNFGYSDYVSLSRINVGLARKNDKDVVVMLKSIKVAIGYMQIQAIGGSPFVVKILSSFIIERHNLPDEILNNFRFMERLHSFDDLCFIVMEYVPGNDMEEYYNDDGASFNPDDMYRITKELYEGLSKIHESGYFHGDIGSWQNIRVTPDLTAVIIDVEGEKITEEQDMYSDVEELANGLWQLIAGNESYETEETGNTIMSEDPRFLSHFEEISSQYAEYYKTLRILRKIFTSKTTAEEIAFF